MVLADQSVSTEALIAIADPTRWEICLRLAVEELCVCHLVADMGLSQSLVSHHLRVLRKAGLLEHRRHSYWTYYRLRKNAFAALGDQIKELAENACEPGECRACC